jgi:D-beta-D-heptose 7-phosphate kinase/D-beta-D-heptose 1-phosphate adenosyltransferase
MGKKVFTNGCFDLLHVGHIRLLQFAKDCGDYLVVGINSDESVKKLKGENRPIVWEQDRKEILQAIRWVDDVIIFNDYTPYELIKNIQPDIIVKGEDWKGKRVVGEDIAHVMFFPFVQGHSTTNLVDKL